MKTNKQNLSSFASGEFILPEAHKRLLLKQGLVLPIVEHFYSIQGEGFHTGKAAYFLRIAGCDIGCKWCDEKLASSANLHLYPLTNVNTIVKEILSVRAKVVVITGGEPMLYNLNPLCDLLKKYKIQTFLETSGTHKLSGKWDWLCLSPKPKTRILKIYYSMADELKVIIETKKDILWAKAVEKKVRPDCKLYLQPEWSKRDNVLPEIISFVKNNPQWRISLQTHKYMGIR